jgi:hypothetical protein
MGISLSTWCKIALVLYVIFWVTSPEVMVLIHRFLTGFIVVGEPKTNATFLLPADKVITRGGRASKWQKMAGYKRAEYRIGGLTGTSLSVYLYVWHRWILYGLGIAAITVVITVAAWLGRIHWDKRVLTRDVIRPLHKMLAPLVDQEAHVTAARWIDVPDDYASNDSAKVVITLPEGFAATAEAKRLIPPLVASRLGGEWDGTFKTTGKMPTLTMRRAPNPPDSVSLADLREAMLAAPEHAPVLGLGSHNKVISVDFNNDSPHIALSMGSGGGKSTAVRALVIQLIRNGADVEIIDIAKRGVSHLWAKEIPGVSIWRTAESAHKALVRLGEEQEGRYDEIYIDPSREKEFNRKVLVFEELNASFKLLGDYWKRTRTKEDPKESPAVSAFASILFAGRQGRINAIVVAQSFTARAIGGPESRENFAVRILGRYSLNAWKMLCPEVWPAPRTNRNVGRVQMVTGAEAFATQVLNTTDEEAYNYATSGDAIRQPVQTTITTEGVTDQVKTYNLAEAVRAKIIPYEYDTAKKIRQRNESFPPLPATEEEIRQWFANYPGTR